MFVKHFKLSEKLYIIQYVSLGEIETDSHSGSFKI